MNPEEFKASLAQSEPPRGLTAPLMALWWDAKQDWSRSHTLVDELETSDGMAVRIPASQRRTSFEREILV
jgi:hypothetical protein